MSEQRTAIVTGGSRGIGRRFPYAAAKAGLLGLACSLALDEARRGIRVNAVSPGLILTRLSREGIEKDASDLSPEQVEADLPMGRGGALLPTI